MTCKNWHGLASDWCAILGITTPPRIVLVPASAIPGCDAVAEFDDARATVWTIKIRRGRHADPDLLMAHELLHVRTGLTDAAHESWICDVSSALAALKRKAE